MHITPIVTNLINSDRQNSQNTAFGYGVSININLPKKLGRNNGNVKKYLDRVERVLRDLKNEFLAIIEKAKTEAQVNEDNMNTIGIKIHAKEDLIPEVVIEVKGIDDTKPITVPEVARIGAMQSIQGEEKLKQIKAAVEQKAKESAALAKQSGSIFSATA